MRAYSLAYLSSAPLDPPGAIELASKTGYSHVGLRIRPAAPGGDFSPLIEDPALLAKTIARIKDTGVAVFDVEIVRINAEFRLEEFKPFLDVAGKLGARAILVAGDDPEEGRLVENFARFAEAAAQFNLSADLEFMPWTPTKCARDAIRIVEAAGAPNGAVLVDALHFGRSETSLDDLRALPAHRLNYVQVCDGTTKGPFTYDQLIYNARIERWMPGDGEIDIAGMLASLPADLPVSVEIPNDALKSKLGLEGFARLALERSKAYG